jgi:hypothetical protein
MRRAASLFSVPRHRGRKFPFQIHVASSATSKVILITWPPLERKLRSVLLRYAITAVVAHRETFARKCERVLRRPWNGNKYRPSNRTISGKRRIAVAKRRDRKGAG